MDMSVSGEGSFVRRLLSGKGLTSVSHIYVMEWAAVHRDIVIGLVVAGAVAAWVPSSFGETLFLTDDPTLAKYGDRTSARSSPSPQFRVLDRQCAAGSGALQQRHQLRRPGVWLAHTHCGQATIVVTKPLTHDGERGGYRGNCVRSFNSRKESRPQGVRRPRRRLARHRGRPSWGLRLDVHAAVGQ